MSTQTTNLGPLVSLGTTNANPSGVPHFEVPSTGTFTLAGTGTFTGAVTQSGTLTVSNTLTSSATIDASAAVFLSKQTTASASSVVLADGEFAVTDRSVTSCRLAFRSGNTTYTFIATTGAVA